MSDKATALRRAAHALEVVERAERWCVDLSAVDNLKLSWTDGSAVIGYDDVREEMQAIVREQWAELRETAVNRLRVRADVALALATES